MESAHRFIHSFSPLWGNDTWNLHAGSFIHSHHYDVMTHGVCTQVQLFSSSWANNVGCLYTLHVFIHHHELIMQGVCTLYIYSLIVISMGSECAESALNLIHSHHHALGIKNMKSKEPKEKSMTIQNNNNQKHHHLPWNNNWGWRNYT